ncbi:MAG TPA: protein kinase [Verrucomicrobiae bacterium]|nr:protein kinase [Verrucomicrobiae bacterium]
MSPGQTCHQCGAALPTEAPEGLCPKCLLRAGLASAAAASAGRIDPFVPATIEEVARLFPHLEILELIGKGGMGAVYKARQPGLDRLVALKILPPSVGDDPGFSERFMREARALAKLNHPNIVSVYDFGQIQVPALEVTAAGVASPPTHSPYLLSYFLMEFVDGANLRQIEQAHRLEPRQALRIIPQICEALQFAHDEGIVHRDIKPENVLLDKKGRVKIADFGLARIVGLENKDQRLTGAGDVMGTPHYMAPEQVERPQTVDHRADIYSLGVVFYEMLTGELPLGRFAPPSRKVQVDVRLDEVVLHTLEKEPERRYQQASQVKTDLQTIAAAGTPAGKSPLVCAEPGGASPASTARPQGIRWTLALGAFAVLVLLMAGLIAAAVSGRWFARPVQPVTAGVRVSQTVLPIPPVVIQTVPESGAADVDPGLTELRVVFSSAMLDENWSWSTLGDGNFPQTTGRPHYLDDGRTCVLPVKLEPGKLYATWLNSDKFHGFQDQQGRPAVPYLLIFKTRK